MSSLPSRRDAIRAVLIGAPLLLLILFARCAGPALARWKRERTAGQDYATAALSGSSGAVWEVTVKKDRLEAAKGVVDAIDAFAARLCPPKGGLGLARPSGMIRLLLLEDRSDLVTYAGTATGKSFDNNGGYYSKKDREICVMWEGRSVAHVLPDLRHEATHLLVDLSSTERGISPWLTEGLASACESGGLPERLEGLAADEVSALEGRDAADDGAALRVRRTRALEALDRMLFSRRYLAMAQQRLARAGTLDLPHVLDAEQSAFMREDNDRYYGVSTATVIYLLVGAGPEARARFLEHVRREREGGPSMAAGLEANVGIPLPELEARVSAWLRTLPTLPDGG